MMLKYEELVEVVLLVKKEKGATTIKRRKRGTTSTRGRCGTRCYQLFQSN
jgi:hypothetical protein